MKVAILVDGLNNKGGVERIVKRQQELFDADVYTLSYDKERSFEIKNVKVFGKAGGMLSRINAFSSIRLEGYDKHIYHGMCSLYATHNHKNNIWYCHAPSRSLYDLFDTEFNPATGLKRMLQRIPRQLLIMKDKANVAKVDIILANSHNTALNVKKIYKKEAEICYPFVDEGFAYIETLDYFFTHARLDKIKRIDLLLREFKGCKYNLVIASDGAEKDKLMEYAVTNNMSNVVFLGDLCDIELKAYLGSCIGTIFLSYKEDFGMVAIESMASGKPVIAFDEGGYRETVKTGKTGYLLNDIEDFVPALDYVSKYALDMKESCQEFAKKFSRDRFDLQMLRVLNVGDIK